MSFNGKAVGLDRIKVFEAVLNFTVEITEVEAKKVQTEDPVLLVANPVVGKEKLNSTAVSGMEKDNCIVNVDKKVGVNPPI